MYSTPCHGVVISLAMFVAEVAVSGLKSWRNFLPTKIVPKIKGLSWEMTNWQERYRGIEGWNWDYAKPRDSLIP